MKTIIKSTLLLLCGLGLFTACSNDYDDNPTLVKPTTFVLNEPAAADASIDIAHSTSVQLTCSQPDYGFTASTTYNVQVSVNADMSDYTELSTTYTTTTMDLDASELASTLTNELLAKNPELTEDDFPITTPVYFRVRANVQNAMGESIDGYEILSNIVSLNKATIEFSLPAVTTPENLYIVGQFCSWDWNNSVTMVPVNSATNIFWHIVYIDKDSGIKFNTDKAWDGNQVGYDGITVGGTLADEICASSDGNIASTKGAWYLMIVTTSVEGRDIKYAVDFEKPEVWTIGWLLADGGEWNELKGETFTVPETMDGEFVSPAFRADLPGNDDNGCVRFYVKIPNQDWWKSEFVVFSDNTAIQYRGNGGDQDRQGCTAGEHLYLNFSKDTGYYGK